MAQKTVESNGGVLKPHVIYIGRSWFIPWASMTFDPQDMNEWIAEIWAEYYFYWNECYTDVISYP